jgi:hypothetical protein
MIAARAAAEKAHAEACQMHPYTEDCMPNPKISLSTWILIGVVVCVILFGLTRIA